MLFEDAYEEYLIFANRQQKKQSYKVFSYNFNANILSFFRDYKLELIKTIDILKWQDYILSKDFCNNHNKNLPGHCNQLHHKGLILSLYCLMYMSLCFVK